MVSSKSFCVMVITCVAHNTNLILMSSGYSCKVKCSTTNCWTFAFRKGRLQSKQMDRKTDVMRCVPHQHPSTCLIKVKSPWRPQHRLRRQGWSTGNGATERWKMALPPRNKGLSSTNTHKGPEVTHSWGSFYFWQHCYSTTLYPRHESSRARGLAKRHNIKVSCWVAPHSLTSVTMCPSEMAGNVAVSVPTSWNDMVQRLSMLCTWYHWA